jgi:hypothetical protein
VKEESSINETETETRALEVTQQDIDQGQPNSAQGCPFALAARRLFPGWNHVSVAPGWNVTVNIQLHRFGLNTAFEEWAVDAKGTAAVRSYDTGAGMLPGTYTLTLAERR